VVEPRQTLAALYRMRDPSCRECTPELVDMTAHGVAPATADVVTVLLAWMNALD